MRGTGKHRIHTFRLSTKKVIRANLFIRLEAEDLINILRECCILDLTIYEFCNALWKLAKIRKQISDETAIIGAKLLEKIVSGNKIRVISQWTDLEARMEKSLKHYVNVYDISYICIAESENLVLVTDDPGMYVNARDVFGINVLHVDELLDITSE